MNRQRDGGHQTNEARPTSLSLGTTPHTRLSDEEGELSPIIQYSPSRSLRLT